MSLVFLSMSGMANAALTAIGTANYLGSDYNLIWDNDNNGHSIVWLDYANWGDWQTQMDWAADLGSQLTVTLKSGYASDIDWTTDWRLPVTYNYVTGYNQTGSEMGHLYYEESIADYFINIVDTHGETWYWSGTNESVYGAWHFNLAGDGRQDCHGGISIPLNGLAVHSGNITTVPIPGALWLLGSGLIGLISLKHDKISSLSA